MGAGRLCNRSCRFPRCWMRSGYLEVWSPREAKDLCQCVEWAGTQAWSSGKVGINGISYYAMNQWHVAPLRPPHLAALCIWEGSADYYRELARHGGILCDFLRDWSRRQVTNAQYGVGERGPRSKVTGAPVAGAETLPEESLRAIAPMSARTLYAIASSTIITALGRRRSTRSTCRCSRPRTGAGMVCTRAAISKATSRPPRGRNGSKCTAIRISRISTARMAPLCRSASSVISSRARTPAGSANPRWRSISAGPASGSPCGRRTVAARAHPVDQISSRSRQPRPGRAGPVR